MGIEAHPLRGLRVLDFTWNLAGPYCALHLALLGAEVIKIESATSLDGMRRGNYVISPDPDAAPTFNSVNLHKLGLRLNLKQPQGVQAVKDLAQVSDVVVENFRTGVLDRMGIGYRELRKYNPTIIVASSSAFGAAGPQKHYPGYASIFNAASGLGHVTGYEEGPPVELRDSIDLRVGATLAFAVLAAVFHRRRTGWGQYIDLSSAEAITSLGGYSLVSYLMTGAVPRRTGNRDASMAPHGIYRCRGDDAWVSIMVATDGDFEALCRAMGRPTLAHDRRFADGYRRLRHVESLDRIVEKWTWRLTAIEVTSALQEAGVAAVPVFNNRDLLDDRHLRARGAWHEVDHPKLGRRPVLGLPWKVSAEPVGASQPGPLLGQHNGYILRDVLGYRPGEVRSMDEAGVFY